jgi:hypothetical protein
MRVKNKAALAAAQLINQSHWVTVVLIIDIAEA